MNKLLTFFGQILRKTDVDFQQSANRDTDVQTHIDLSDKTGGVVDGLNVLPSNDGRSILITPGVFYTKGDFNVKNNIGGGERGQLFTTQSFTGLPQTTPISNQPSFLLVYAKVINSNVNPDPTQSQTVATSKNILTGENIPIRSYAQGTIVVSNPILRSEVSKFNGIPLALITVDYDSNGNQKSFNGTIQDIIVDGIKQPYLVGGSVDILNNQIIDQGIPDGLITNRMLSNNSLDGAKLADGAVGSPKIAPWDGSTANNDLTGDGVATQHIKDGAITTNKLSYTQSVDGFSARNRLRNSSFEISETGNSNFPQYWNLSAAGTSEIRIGLDTADSFPVKYGRKSILFNGGEDSSGAYELTATQTVDFEENLSGKPITPFFWAQINQISLATTSGTTWLQGKIEFLNDNDTIAQENIFATVSGTVAGWRQYSSSGPIIYSGTSNPSKIRYTLGGFFGGSYYVDGAFLGMTDLLPEFDIKPSEFSEISGFEGEITTDQIEDGAIVTRKIRNADGTRSTDLGAGIISSQLRDGSVTNTKLASNSVTVDKIDPGAGLIPSGAMILWDQSTTCPSGFTRVTEIDGRFLLGANILETPNSIDAPQRATESLRTQGDSGFTGDIGETFGGGSHNHSVPTAGNFKYQGGGPNEDSVAFISGPGNQIYTSTDTEHTHKEKIPYYTIVLCRKNS